MLENIDIGGPAMIRAAAKNHADVAVIVDVADYPRCSTSWSANDGATRLDFRRALAQKAYARTAAYDAAISNWLARETRRDRADVARVRRQARERAALRREPAPERRLLRRAEPRPGVATARQVQGKELSYNNINDTDAAYELVAEFDPKRRPRWRSSSTPTPAASRSARPCWRPTRRRSPAIPSPPSAASSR